VAKVEQDLGLLPVQLPVAGAAEVLFGAEQDQLHLLICWLRLAAGAAHHSKNPELMHLQEVAVRVAILVVLVVFLVLEDQHFLKGLGEEESFRPVLTLYSHLLEAVRQLLPEVLVVWVKVKPIVADSAAAAATPNLAAAAAAGLAAAVVAAAIAVAVAAATTVVVVAAVAAAIGVAAAVTAVVVAAAVAVVAAAVVAAAIAGKSLSTTSYSSAL
jgi:hypothetical protein